MRRSASPAHAWYFLAGVLVFLAIGLSACMGDAGTRSTGQVVDDSTITARVKTAFARSPEVDALDIEVQTYRGVVQLSGFADSQQQADRAVELARSVDGVQSVENKIQVKGKAGS
jgi:hyperosmotically inducible protein